MAVTANQLINRQDGDKIGIPVAASTRIYQGTLVFTTPGAGYADDDTASGVNAFAGVAIEEKDNSSGSAGDLDIDVWKCGTFELVGSGFSQDDVGAQVYANDNYTIVTTRTAASVYVGVVEEFVSATKLMVRIDPKGDPVTAIASLTDNSGGTASDTLADVTEANNAGSADRVPTEDAIASLAAKINGLIDALEVKGVIEPN